jgi:phage terminase small subunit
MTRHDLTPKQAAFVQQYLVDLNATQSAVRAGYSAKTAREIGAENLTKPAIRAAIDSGGNRSSPGQAR